MAKTITAQQARDRKILRELVARRNGIQVPLSDEERALVERVAGRRITNREALSAELYKADTRSFEDRYRQDGFRAVLPPSMNDPDGLEAAIAKATERADAERELANMKNMTPGEIELQQLKKAREKNRIARETEAARSARLAERGADIDKLRLELAVALLDETYDISDVAKIKNALAQLMEPESCPEVCKKMTAEALAVPNAVNTRHLNAVMEHLQAVTAAAEEIKSTLNVVMDPDPANLPSSVDLASMTFGEAKNL